jgi:DNA-binding transcriptional LysR family regulator
VNLDKRRLKAAIGVADDLSFSRAAARLGVTQPALSAQIQQLERDLGFQLFRRSTRRVELTGQGARFVAEARRLVEAHERLERLVRGIRREGQAHVAIGTAIYTIDFPDRVRLLEGLVEACPDIRVDILTGISQASMIPDLASGELDLAILMGVPIPSEDYRRAAAGHAGREVLFDRALRTLVLRRAPVGLLVPAESPLARRPRLAMADLAGQRVAMLHSFHGEQLCGPVTRYLQAAGAEIVLPPEPNAIGVERYGRQFRVPAVTLGWFPQPADGRMERCELEGLDVETQLVLAADPESTGPVIERVFAFAEALFGVRDGP